MEVPSLGGLPRVALTRDLADSACSTSASRASRTSRHAENRVAPTGIEPALYPE